MKTSFSITIMGSCTSKNNCSGQWRRESASHMYDINGLPDLASDCSPLFVEPMFLFGWALCKNSIYCMLTFWLSCVNNALWREFPLLHVLLQDIFTYTLFWLPGVNLFLKNQLSYYTISFSWHKLCWNQSFYAMNFPLTFIIFFAKVTTLSLNENAFPSYQIHRRWSLTCSTTLHCCCCCAS